MKIVRTTLLVTTFLFSVSCHGNKLAVKTDKEEAQNKEMYDFIRIDRRGGGDKLVDLYPTASKDTLKAEVLRYNFRNTNETFFIVNNAERDSAFLVYHEILKGEKGILADSISKNEMLTGTWVHYYAVKDTIRIEITNEEVKDILSRFEWMLKDALSE
jgi:hypothetical protein